MQELKRYHPFVITSFVFAFLIWETLSNHPLLKMLILIISWILMMELPEISLKQCIKGNLMLICLVGVSNPIFQHRGEWVLFELGNTSITVESIAYGLDLGCMLAGMMNFLRMYSHMIHTDQILFMLAKISCNTAIVCSLSLQQLSRMKKQYQDIVYARSLWKPCSSWKERIKENIAITSCMITWLMETSVETSLSMRSRGFQGKNRSNYTRYRWERRDRILLFLIWACIIIGFYGLQGFSFWWYPSFYQEIEISKAMVFLIAIISITVLPLCLKKKEMCVWEDIKSI